MSIDLVTGAVEFSWVTTGASPQWSDDSDSTWAQARTSTTGQNNSAGLTLAQLATPAASATVTLTVRVAVTAPAAQGPTVPLTFALYPSTTLYPSPRPNGYWTASTDGAARDYSTTLTDQLLVDAFAAERVLYEIGFHEVDFGGVDHGSTLTGQGDYFATIFEASVLVSTGGVRYIRKCRRFPRDD